MKTDRIEGNDRQRGMRRDMGADRHDEDPYRSATKPPEPTKCPQCSASFQNGRWSWAKAPSDSHVQLCPACQREQDQFPAGYVSIKGQFFASHRDTEKAPGMFATLVVVVVLPSTSTGGELLVRHKLALQLHLALMSS